MKKRKWHFFDTRARLERLEREVEALRRERTPQGMGLSALTGASPGVPLSQVISEYLYGEEEHSNG